MNQIIKAPLHGEILAPGSTFTVVVVKRVLSTDSTRFEMEAGATIYEAIQEAARREGLLITPTRDVVVTLGEWPIERELWKKVRVKPGMTLALRAAPRKGLGNILKTILQVVLLVLSLVLTPFLTPIFGSLMAGLIVGGITLAGSFLLNMLFPIEQPKLDKEKSTTYSIGGARNEVTRYGAIPSILGFHRVSPKYGAAPYTEFIGNDQYLRLLFIWGYGPLSISNFRIGETPLSQFDDVDVEHFYGYASDTKPTLYPKEVLQQDLSVRLDYDDGWQQRTTALETNEIGIDLVAAQGLIRLGKDGSKKPITVTLEIQYRVVGAGSWTSRPDFVVTDKSQEPLRFGIRWKVAGGAGAQYDVRIRRTTLMEGGNPDTPANYVESFTWSALKSFRNDASVAFPKKLAMTCLRIKATDQLNGVVDTFNADVKSLVLSYDYVSDTWIPETASNNCADMFRWVLQGSANARPTPNSGIDLTQLKLWHNYCRIQGFKYNYIHDTARSVLETLRQIAAAGRAFVIRKDGKWSVVWDEQNTPIVQYFTPRNSWGFQGKRVYQRMPDALRVRFINQDKKYLEDERFVYMDGKNSTNSTKFEVVEFPGVTNPQTIWRHGRFHLAQALLRPEQYTLTVDAENLICNKGDRVRVSHDMPKFGLVACRVESYSAPVLVLDAKCSLAPGKSYGIRFRNPDGTSFVRGVAETAIITDTFNLTTGSGTPAEGALAMFGELGEETVILRVLSIEPTGKNFEAEITMVDDAPEISDADTGSIPDYDSQITEPVDPITTTPSQLTVQETVSRKGGATVSTTKLTWAMLDTKPATDYYQVSVMTLETADGASSWWRIVGRVDAPKKSFIAENMEPGDYSFRVRARFTNGYWSGWSEAVSVSLRGASGTPLTPTNLQQNILGGLTVLSWDGSDDPLTAAYAIRYTPDQNPSTAWSAAQVIVPKTTEGALQHSVPTRDGTYLVKAIGFDGVESVDHAAVVNTNPGVDTNSVVTVIENTFTAGTFTDTYKQTPPGHLRLSQDGDPNHCKLDGYYVLGGGYTDLSEVYTSKVTVKVTAYGASLSNVMASWATLSSLPTLGGAEANPWRVELEYRVTNDDPAGSPTWGPWTPLGVSDIVGRAYQFRLHLWTSDNTVTPMISSCIVSIDMPDRIISAKGVSVGTGGLTVNFSPAFKELKSLVITAPNMNSAGGEYYTITGKSATGFTIQFSVIGGSPVARTIDYVAHGYGRVT